MLVRVPTPSLIVAFCVARIHVSKSTSDPCCLERLGHPPTLPQDCSGQAILHYYVSLRMDGPMRLALISIARNTWPRGGAECSEREARGVARSIDHTFQRRSMRSLVIEDE